MIKVELPEQVWGEILNILGQAPFSRVAPIISDITRQLTIQRYDATRNGARQPQGDQNQSQSDA